MAANEVTIVNMAMARLGQRRLFTSSDGTVANIVETTWPLTPIVQDQYEVSRDTVLRAFPWDFAKTYLLLTLDSDGDGEDWEDEWGNSYTYPDDCLAVRRFITGAGPTDPQPPAFEIGLNNGTKVIFTDVDEADAKIVYTAQITDATEYPEDFTNCLAWRLAADLAMAATSDGNKRREAFQEYMVAISKATRTDANEFAAHEEEDGEFLRERD
jgi:hypothetical protein